MYITESPTQIGKECRSTTLKKHRKPFVYLWRSSPVSNEITAIPVLEEATMMLSSQQHVTLPISCPASGTVSNNEPSLMSQTLITPSCDPVTKQCAINNWPQHNWLEISNTRELTKVGISQNKANIISETRAEFARGTSYVLLRRQAECDIAALISLCARDFYRVTVDEGAARIIYHA